MSSKKAELTFTKDENVFKFEYNNLENILTIQLISKEDYLTDSSVSSEEKWSVYVDRYMQLGATEGIYIKPNEPFLRRNLPQVIPDEPPNNLIMHSGLELKICVNTYKLFFVNNTEDYFRRCNVKIPDRQLKAIRDRRKNKFIKWFATVNNISEEESKKSLAFDEKETTNIDNKVKESVANTIAEDKKEDSSKNNEEKTTTTETESKEAKSTTEKPAEPVKDN